MTASEITPASYLPAAPLIFSAAASAVIDRSLDGFGQQINVEFVAPGSSLPKQFHPNELGRSDASRQMTPRAKHTKTWSGGAGEENKAKEYFEVLKF